jgi:NADH:ubiquinone oxidoreductase subunit H
MNFLLDIIAPLSLLITALLSVALITLVERKVMAAVQGRIGPNVVGYFGIGQPFADAAKLILKETISTFASNGYLFFISPVMIFILALLAWGIVIFEEENMLYDFPLNSLVIALITSLMGQYILFSGWSSGSKYALLGSLRATAQFISYEMFISLALLNVSLSHQTLNLSEIIYYQEESGINFSIFYLAFVFFFVATMAENNRPPFDFTRS